MIKMVESTLNGEFKIILPEHRAARKEWHEPGGWEKARLQSMHKNIGRGDVVLYVGSEEADMCGLVASWGGDLIMMEPNDRVWPNAKAIWEANNFKPPLVCFVGFAANNTDLKGIDALYLNEFPLCADGEVIPDHGFKELAYEADVIPQIKIDDLLKHIDVTPTVISLDVEGSEFEVLRGAEQLLRDKKPKIYLSLHPEFMFRMFNEYSRDLRDWIISLGYKETFLDWQHEGHFFYEKD